MPDARLYPVPGGLALQSDYHGELVAEIKALPYSDRKWDKASRAWIIAPAHADKVARLVEMYLGVTLQIPQLAPASTSPEIRMVKVDYLGRCKYRGDGETTATGYTDGAWSLVFPEQVLRDWFEAGEVSQPDELKTLYQILAVKATATPDEIKKAYRTLARQWHPDVCKEPDASERFREIKSAYDVLSDDLGRRKYDVGLRLEQHAKEQELNQHPHRYAVASYSDYRSPLRCGLLLVEGQARVGQFIVSKIYKWEDIVDNLGRTMVSSWKLGDDKFTISWV